MTKKYKPKTTPRDCVICGKTFAAVCREIARGNGKFCSLRCFHARPRDEPKPKEHNTDCAYCGVRFYRDPGKKSAKSGLFFCCRAHKDAAQQIGSGIPIQPPRVVLVCDCYCRMLRTL